MAGDNVTGRVRIFAVVVLYGVQPSQSNTVTSLAGALRGNSRFDCDVLLYDNSPSPAAPGELPPGFIYHHAAVNAGLYGAYETARAMASTQSQWLLTLDQDTTLPEDFFSAIQPGLQAAQQDRQIAAIVPHLAEGERLLSPAYVTIGRPRPLSADFTGVPEREARAFNSAALLRVSALEAIGGFDPRFWLDHLDSWLHHQLFLHGLRMYVLPLRLEHHFSLLNYRERVSIEHLRNFIAAESAWEDLYRSPAAGIGYTVQLAVRLLNQIRRGESREVRDITRRALQQRLTTPKQRRIDEWSAAMLGRVGASAPGVPPAGVGR